MKNFSVRISKVALPLLVLTFMSFASQAQNNLSINGKACAGTWSLSSSTTGTVLTVPDSCVTGTVTQCIATGVPTITSFTPTTGAATTVITVSGTNFCNVTSVTVNGVAATGVTTSSGSSLTAVVGAGTTTGPIVVTSTGGISAPSANFTVAALVSLSSVSPNPIIQGATLTVTGANFVAGAVTINIGATQIAAATSTTTSATALVPASVINGSYQVSVTSNGQTTSGLQLTVGPVTAGCGVAGTDCSVEGDVIPTPSRTNPGGNTASRSGKLNGPGPINAQMNSYAAEKAATKCSNATPAINRLWQHNISFPIYATSGGNDYPFLAPNEAMTWRFIAPAEGTTQVIQYNEGTQVFNSSGYLSISDKPCDFDVNKLVPGSGKSACHSSEATGVSIYYKATNGTAASYECKMIPGQTYYLNLRMQDARPASQGGSPTIDSCAASGAGLCGGYVQIR
jgi:hypothetical protein